MNPTKSAMPVLVALAALAMAGCDPDSDSSTKNPDEITVSGTITYENWGAASYNFSGNYVAAYFEGDVLSEAAHLPNQEEEGDSNPVDYAEIDGTGTTAEYSFDVDTDLDTISLLAIALPEGMNVGQIESLSAFPLAATVLSIGKKDQTQDFELDDSEAATFLIPDLGGLYWSNVASGFDATEDSDTGTVAFPGSGAAIDFTTDFSGSGAVQFSLEGTWTGSALDLWAFSDSMMSDTQNVNTGFGAQFFRNSGNNELEVTVGDGGSNVCTPTVVDSGVEIGGDLSLTVYFQGGGSPRVRVWNTSGGGEGKTPAYDSDEDSGCSTTLSTVTGALGSGQYSGVWGENVEVDWMSAIY